MRFKVSLIILLCLATHVKAQNSPEEIVTSFGEALSSWCSTNEIIYREKIDELCSGAKKCRVEDKIHAEYQKGRGLTNYETFVLDSYMNMFESLIPQSLNYQMSNIKVVGTDEMPEGTLTFITADINVSGAINKRVTDLFLVRNDKITGIYSHSSNLGFSHLNGSLINALKIGRYRWCSYIINGYVRVVNEAGKEGLIDIKGNVIVPCIWDAVRFNGGDFASGGNYKDNVVKHITYDLRADGKRTPLYHVDDFCFNRDGKFSTFFENYAVVRNNEGKYGYLNKCDHTYTVQYIYDDASIFCNGYAFVKYVGVGMIIDERFKPVLKDTKEYIICDSPSDGLFKVKDRMTGKYGFINKKGELVIPCKYDRACYFSEGVCPVTLKDGKNELGYDRYKWGCINTQGDIIIPIIYDNFASIFAPCFENGYIEAVKDGKGTLLGANGEPLPGFSWEYDRVCRISEGLASFKKDNKLGFLNSKGEVVIPPTAFTGIYHFSEGIACVRSPNGKYGAINTDGIIVIPCIYDEGFIFENGIALVQKDKKVGLIDKYGNSTFLP